LSVKFDFVEGLRKIYIETLVQNVNRPDCRDRENLEKLMLELILIEIILNIQFLSVINIA